MKALSAERAPHQRHVNDKPERTEHQEWIPVAMMNKGTYNNGTSEVGRLGQQGQTWELSHCILTLALQPLHAHSPWGTHSASVPGTPGSTHRPFSSVPLSFWVCCTLHHVHYFLLDPSGEFLLENSAQLSHSSGPSLCSHPAELPAPLPLQVGAPPLSPPCGFGSIILQASVPHP